METENSQNVFSVSITHNSKIRELSDGNRVIVCQTTFLLWVPPFLSYKLWKLRIELWKLPIQIALYYPTSLLVAERSYSWIYLLRMVNLGKSHVDGSPLPQTCV